MKSTTLSGISALVVSIALATSTRTAAQGPQGQQTNQTFYLMKDLGTLGGTLFADAEGISNRGWVAGFSNVAGDQAKHAFLWRPDEGLTDLGTLGGLNSSFNFPVKADREFIAGQAETSHMDPLAENFCGYGTSTGSVSTGLICGAFLWEKGVMTQLPTLGGSNAYALNMNHQREIVGATETSTPDPNCAPPQQLTMRGVVWGPRVGQIRVLPPFPGIDRSLGIPDGASVGVAINDRGQVVGQSGICANPYTGGTLLRAVTWQPDGTMIDLGTLGGVYAFPWAINNKGQVIGQSSTPGEQTVHGFLWENGAMTDLGLLPDFNFFNLPFGLNDKGEVVGVSSDTHFDPHGYLWQDGVLTDLSERIKPGSTPLELIWPNDINDDGEIAGFAFDPNASCPPPNFLTGFSCMHAVLLIPCDEKHAGEEGCKQSATNSNAALAEPSARPKVPLPENVREQLRKRLLLGRFGAPLTRPR